MLHINFKKQIKSVSGDTALEVKALFKNIAITGIYGNSGEGKSTLFNIIAGLNTPEYGILHYKDLIWLDTEKKINLSTQKRNTGYIFQTNSLFPHFTVKENILYAVQKENQDEVNVSELLNQVDMMGMEDRYPHQLSGGQVQRIAIARALAQKAQIILMDEPFSALDLEIKQKLYRFIKVFKKKYNLMILIVTHDINDIFYLCDEVLWIRNHKASGTIPINQFKEEIELKLKDL
jgi:molybdate transport system ATP-binding protein